MRHAEGAAVLSLMPDSAFSSPGKTELAELQQAQQFKWLSCAGAGALMHAQPLHQCNNLFQLQRAPQQLRSSPLQVPRWQGQSSMWHSSGWWHAHPLQHT